MRKWKELMGFKKKKILFRRPCRDCEKYFRPTGTSGKVCDACQIRLNKERQDRVNNKRKGL